MHADTRIYVDIYAGTRAHTEIYIDVPIRKVDLLGDMKFALSRHEIVSGFHVGGQ